MADDSIECAQASADPTQKFLESNRLSEATITPTQIIGLTAAQIASLDGYPYRLDISSQPNEQLIKLDFNLTLGQFKLTYVSEKGWHLQAKHMEGWLAAGSLVDLQKQHSYNRALKRLCQFLEQLTPNHISQAAHRECINKIILALGYPPEGHLCYHFAHQLTIPTLFLTTFFQPSDNHDTTLNTKSEDHDSKNITQLKQQMNQLARLGKRAETLLQSSQPTTAQSQTSQALVIRKPNEIKLTVGVCVQEQNNLLNCLAAVYSRQAQLLSYSYELNPNSLLGFYQEVMNDEFQLTPEETYNRCLDIINSPNSATMDSRYKKDIYGALARLTEIKAGNQATKESLQWRCYEALQEHMSNIYLTVANDLKDELTDYIIPLITDAINLANTSAELTPILSALKLKVGERKTLPKPTDLGKLLPSMRPNLDLDKAGILALEPYQLKILTPEHCHRYVEVLKAALDQILSTDNHHPQRPRVESDATIRSSEPSESSGSGSQDDSFDSTGSDDSGELSPQPTSPNKQTQTLANKCFQILKQAQAFCTDTTHNYDETVLQTPIGGSTVSALLEPTAEDRHYAALCDNLAEQIREQLSPSPQPKALAAMPFWKEHKQNGQDASAIEMPVITQKI